MHTLKKTYLVTSNIMQYTKFTTSQKHSSVTKCTNDIVGYSSNCRRPWNSGLNQCLKCKSSFNIDLIPSQTTVQHTHNKRLAYITLSLHCYRFHNFWLQSCVLI